MIYVMKIIYSFQITNNPKAVIEGGGLLPLGGTEMNSK